MDVSPRNDEELALSPQSLGDVELYELQRLRILAALTAEGTREPLNTPGTLPGAGSPLLPPAAHDEIVGGDEDPQDFQQLPIKHVAANQDIHRIYYQPLGLMVMSYLSSLLAGIVHHLVYHYFDGREVLNNTEQAWALRTGNLLATAVKLFLSAPVWFAYVQWLWKVLKKRAFTFRGVDAMFSVPASFLPIFNIELLTRNFCGLFLIIVAWGVQVPPIFTPATLTVAQEDRYIPTNAGVSWLDVASAGQAHRYAYFTPMNATYPDADPHSFVFEGPRTLPTRLARATASFGEILSVPPPANRSSYELRFLAPRVRCTSGNATVVEYVEALLAERNRVLLNSSSQESLGYYAFVPSYPLHGLTDVDNSNTNTVAINGTSLTALDQPRLQVSPRNATNELWTMYYRYETGPDGSYILDGNGSRIAQKQYSVCSLWNTTQTTSFRFDNAFQGVRNVSMEDINQVAYPAYDASRPSDLGQHSYTAMFSVLTDLLVGDMGFITSTAPNLGANSSFGAINSPIAGTSLLGSDDLDYVFALNRYTQGTPLGQISVPYQLSDQRILDKALAQNQTLPFLIEQLAFNITMSMMNDPLLAPSTVANITQINTVNVYVYNARNLWLSYGMAYYLVVLTLIIAWIAIHENHASHNSSVSALLSISRDEALAPLFPKCCRGKQPLPTETMDAELMIRGDPEKGESLRPQGSVMPVCKACNTRSSPPRDRRPSRALGRRRRDSSGPLLPK